jgi:hypothetical protein
MPQNILLIVTEARNADLSVTFQKPSILLRISYRTFQKSLLWCKEGKETTQLGPLERPRFDYWTIEKTCLHVPEETPNPPKISFNVSGFYKVHRS